MITKLPYHAAYDRLYPVAAALLFVLWASFFVLYQKELLDVGFFVDPAENESLYLNNINDSVRMSVSELLKQGALPIYPDFYYLLASCFDIDDKLKELRIISFGGFWLSILFVYLICLRVGMNKSTSLLVAASFFGPFVFATYYNMARVDSVMAAFAFASFYFYILGSGHFKQVFLLLVLSAFLGAVSLVTKQSSVFLLALIFFYGWFYRNKGGLKERLATPCIYTALVLMFTLVYFFIVSEWTVYSFFMGLDLYGANSSYVHALNVFLVYLKNFWFQCAAVLYVAYKSRFLIKKKLDCMCGFQTVISFFLFVLMFFLLLKIISNVGASFNNYFYMTFFLFVVLISLCRERGGHDRSVGVFALLGVLFSVYSFSDNRLYVFDYLRSIKEMGDIENSVIVRAIKESDKVLSWRGDNFLYAAGITPVFDASVMGEYALSGNRLPRYYGDIPEGISEKVAEVRADISNSYFDYIVLGVGDNAFKFDPALRRNYVELDSIESVLGVNKYSITVWKRL